jgi:outer membrane receptor for ferric coprogen and ferric-rhodotorulic acid
VGGGLYSQNWIYNKDVNFYDSGTPMYVEQKGYALVDLRMLRSTRRNRAAS